MQPKGGEGFYHGYCKTERAGAEIPGVDSRARRAGLLSPLQLKVNVTACPVNTQTKVIVCFMEIHKISVSIPLLVKVTLTNGAHSSSFAML